ncbi:DUF6371 domain-containing protein [Polaribacter sp.]|nr:DUF6371 domain-containing protein [Polaribacter sp.]
MPKYNLKKCLFGLYLLNDNVKQVAIIESEKTALIMSIESPNYARMSTGSFNGFKYEYLAPLKETVINAFRNKGDMTIGRIPLSYLTKKGFNIEVSKLLENKDFKDGWDLVDVLIYESEK